MQDVALEIAGVFAILIAIVHGILGEVKVFARTRIEPERMRTLLRAIWQCSTAAWIAGGVLFIAASQFPPAARRWFVLAFICVYGIGALGNFAAFRGRHYGWMLMALVISLAFAGL